MSTAGSPAPPAIDANALYWLEGSGGGLPPQIAALVAYDAKRQLLSFHNTSRHHALGARFVSGTPATGLVFELKNALRVTLLPLNRATFEKVFRPLTYNAPAFRSEAELTAFYVNLCRNA